MSMKRKRLVFYVKIFIHNIFDVAYQHYILHFKHLLIIYKEMYLPKVSYRYFGYLSEIPAMLKYRVRNIDSQAHVARVSFTPCAELFITTL